MRADRAPCAGLPSSRQPPPRQLPVTNRDDDQVGAGYDKRHHLGPERRLGWPVGSHAGVSDSGQPFHHAVCGSGACGVAIRDVGICHARNPRMAARKTSNSIAGSSDELAPTSTDDPLRHVPQSIRRTRPTQLFDVDGGLISSQRRDVEASEFTASPDLRLRAQHRRASGGQLTRAVGPEHRQHRLHAVETAMPSAAPSPACRKHCR